MRKAFAYLRAIYRKSLPLIIRRWISKTNRFVLLPVHHARYYYNLRHPRKVSDKVFYKYFGRKINYTNPVDLNEKIHWLKFYSDTSCWPALSDKYRVREYVIRKGLAHTLNELYAVFGTPDEIDIAKLPSSFVLKMNNGSGDILIVKDKSRFTNRSIRKYFRKQPKKFGVFRGEFHYWAIEPCIIAERLLEEDKNNMFIPDFKIYCFNGKPKYILYLDRNKGKHFRVTYDLNWQPIPQEYYKPAFRIDIGTVIEEPGCLPEMIEMSRKLSSDFPFVRVDWYVIQEKPVFGEMTFTPVSGYIYYYTQEFLDILGGQLQLPDRGMGRLAEE